MPVYQITLHRMVQKKERATVVVSAPDRETAIQQAYDDAFWTEIERVEMPIGKPEMHEVGT
jgi:hypothetical protein